MNLSKNYKQLAGKAGFKISRVLHVGTYYDPDIVRDIVLLGKFRGQKAVMKISSWPEGINEIKDILSFFKNNKSKTVTAPKVLSYKPFDGEKSWFISEFVKGTRIIPGSWPNPLSSSAEKEEMAKIYVEYIKNFRFANRPPALIESRDAAFFVKSRFFRWLDLANNSTHPKKDILLPRFDAALKILERGFKNRPLQYVHSHFSNDHIIKSKGKYYLVDFANAGYKPELYELGFVVWNLSFLSCWQSRVGFKRWLKETTDWENVFLKLVAGPLNYKEREFLKLLRLNMLERCIGAILADIAANKTRTENEKKWMLNIYLPLADYYIKKLFR